jgi:large subunit ribosomal protein L9
MKLILKEDVDQLGRMGELVDVADGYARNFLLPRKKAAVATTKNVKALEHEKRVIADQMKKEKAGAEALAKKVGELSISIPAQVGEEGKLFGSVTSKDIAEAMAAQGFEIDKRKILLDKPIKELGTFQVPVKVHHDVTAQVKVEVVKAEEPQA